MTTRPDEAQTVTLEPCPFCGDVMVPVAHPEHRRRSLDHKGDLITHYNVDCPLADLQFKPHEWNRRTLQRIQSAQGEAMPEPVARYSQAGTAMVPNCTSLNGNHCGYWVKATDYDAAIAHLNGLLARERDKLAKAMAGLRETYEIYAGMEGMPLPLLASEHYLLRIIDQMQKSITALLSTKDK